MDAHKFNRAREQSPIVLNEDRGRCLIVGQTQYVQALYEAKVFSGLKPYTVDEMERKRAATEEETGLDFSAVRPFGRHMP